MNGVPKDIYSHRSPEETMALYSDWAEDYDAAVAADGYATPGRVAAALAAQMEARDAPILDFGCGTGLSGAALREAGFETIDGTDITPEMLEQARQKGVYRTLIVGTPGAVDDLSAYAAVTATGVIGLGAAPADTLGLLLDAMRPGALLVFSYNDAALRSRDYLGALMEAQMAGHVILRAEYGPHLPKHEGAEGSTVIVLRRA